MKHYKVTWQNGRVTSFAYSKEFSLTAEFIKAILTNRHAKNPEEPKPLKVTRVK